MNSKAALFVFCFCFCSFASFAENSKNIRIIGNNRISADYILNIIGNQKISDDTLSHIMKEIYATKFFSDVKLTLKNGVLDVYVDENPIISGIVISGNKSISETKIIDLMKVKQYTTFDPVQLNNDIRAIEYLYKSKGRTESKIIYNLKKVDSTHSILFLEINEGPITKIKKIDFIGNKSFSSATLSQVIVSREAAFFRIFGSSYYFISERLDLDKEMLTKFYLSHGYFNFRVASVEVNPTKDGNEHVTFVLDEGEIQKFGEIKILNHIKEINIDNPQELLLIHTGGIFNMDMINKTAIKIKRYFDSKGYYFTEIIPRYDTSNANVVGIVFEVNLAPKIYVNRINITGNDATTDSVIRKNIPFDENDPFDVMKLKWARQNILNLGFFDEADFNMKNITDDGIDIDFFVKEKGTGLINISVNYRSDIGFALNFGISESNLFGEGNAIGLTLKKAMNYFEGSLVYTKPNLFDTDITGSVSLFGQYQVGSGSVLFNTGSIGSTFSLGVNFTEKLSGSLYYTYNYNNIYNVSSLASDAIKEQEGESIISLVGYSLSYNTLDSYVLPTSGYILRVGQSLAGIGGNLNFVKTEASNNFFIPVLPKHRVITQIISKFGYVFGYSGQSVKVGQRFFMYDMRGFEPSGLGPRDAVKGDSLGGNLYFFNTVQTEFPLGLPSEFDVNGSVFFDIGTVTGLDNNKGVLDSGLIRASLGFGVVWKSAMGPIRLDFAFPVVREAYDKTAYIKPSAGYFS